jgi:hypothetical protein
MLAERQVAQETATVVKLSDFASGVVVPGMSHIKQKVRVFYDEPPKKFKFYLGSNISEFEAARPMVGTTVTGEPESNGLGVSSFKQAVHNISSNHSLSKEQKDSFLTLLTMKSRYSSKPDEAAEVESIKTTVREEEYKP